MAKMFSMIFTNLKKTQFDLNLTVGSCLVAITRQIHIPLLDVQIKF